ncbi:hypothetical protein H9P43_005092 [Blastocladiella emersonii ATCC 22665]|nr:hypothetical protein H9P43_005092 [Blastocladiella emersonii ATCC 22665]
MTTLDVCPTDGARAWIYFTGEGPELPTGNGTFPRVREDGCVVIDAQTTARGFGQCASVGDFGQSKETIHRDLEMVLGQEPQSVDIIIDGLTPKAILKTFDTFDTDDEDDKDDEISVSRLVMDEVINTVADVVRDSTTATTCVTGNLCAAVSVDHPQRGRSLISLKDDRTHQIARPPPDVTTPHLRSVNMSLVDIEQFTKGGRALKAILKTYAKNLADMSNVTVQNMECLVVNLVLSFRGRTPDAATDYNRSVRVVLIPQRNSGTLRAGHAEFLRRIFLEHAVFAENGGRRSLFIHVVSGHDKAAQDSLHSFATALVKAKDLWETARSGRARQAVWNDKMDVIRNAIKELVKNNSHLEQPTRRSKVHVYERGGANRDQADAYDLNSTVAEDLVKLLHEAEKLEDARRACWVKCEDARDEVTSIRKFIWERDDLVVAVPVHRPAATVEV